MKTIRLKTKTKKCLVVEPYSVARDAGIASETKSQPEKRVI